MNTGSAMPGDIDVFNCPLEGVNLIEASAGTGKTWTLTALYLRAVLELDRAVSEILVVTYTKAATAELRERIRGRLAATQAALAAAPGAAAIDEPFLERLLATTTARGIEPERLRRRIDRALAAFDEAAIFTIHGFCQRALGDTPVAGGVPLKLELVADEGDLQLRALADAWRRQVGHARLAPEFAAYLADHPLTPELLQPLLTRRRARPLADEKWPQAPQGSDGLGEFRSAFAAMQAAWPRWRDEAGECLHRAIGSVNRRRYSVESIAACLAGWDSWLAAPAAAASAPPPAAQKLELLTSSTLAASLNAGKTPPRHPGFDLAEAVLSGWNAVAAHFDAEWRALLRRILDDGEAALAAEKTRQRVVGYDDLLRNLHLALHRDPSRGAALAAELRRRFPVALVDEFQDTDPQQWAILSRVWTPPLAGSALFLVGDPKQAIYRFRNADVATYLAARAHCTSEYTLSQNQRSRPPMIAAVNALFGRNPAAFMRPGLAFRPAAVGGRPRAEWQAPPDLADALRIWLLPPAADGPMLYAEAFAAALAASAGEIGRLIADGARGAIRIGGQGLRPGDIAVLVRSHAQAARMRAVLAGAGIDSVELAHESVWHSREASDLGFVLAAIAEPQDETLLRAALATEMVGLDAAALLALDDGGGEALAGHVERFLGYRELWRSRGFAPMWRALLAAERVVARLLAAADGERRLTNLLHLGELIQAAAHPAGEGFLRWFREQRATAGEHEDAALRLESDRDLVQIVTVHKSKGLEYPVVFCPLLWARTRGGDHAAIAGVETFVDGQRIVDFGSDDKMLQGAKASARREAAEEDLRLVYVALTRAVHRCYLVTGIYGRPTRGAPSPREAQRQLLHWLVAGTGIDPERWIDREAKPDPRPDPAVLDQAWRSLADASITVEDLPLQEVPAAPRPRPDAATLAVRPWSRSLAESFRIGSFSGLMRHGGRFESPAADRDEWLAAAEPRPPAATAPPADDDILGFPRGALAGECLHAIFEHADFTCPQTWPDAIAGALRRFPVADEAAGAERLAAMATNMLHAVTATVLVDDIRLADLPPSRRLNELAFSFPARLERGALAAAFAALGYPLPPLEPGRLDGYLAGFVDLVFEAGGRFYLVDWKSNHLGDTAAAYGPPAVGQAMSAHGYHLQAQIYALALHRYLGRRLPDYDQPRHFGGILYLFVRGVRPGWRDASGRPCGVYFDRPDAATMRAIAELLG